MAKPAEMVLLKFWCTERGHKNARRFMGQQVVPRHMALAVCVYPPTLMCPNCGGKRVAEVEVFDVIDNNV